jgi:acyl carrier protein
MEVTNLQTTNKLPEPSEIQTWIISYLAELLQVDPEQVDPTIPFDRYGLDSSAAYALTGDLEDWLGREIDPTAIYDYPTVERLSEHLSSMVAN